MKEGKKGRKEKRKERRKERPTFCLTDRTTESQDIYIYIARDSLPLPFVLIGQLISHALNVAPGLTRCSSCSRNKMLRTRLARARVRVRALRP